MNLYDTIIIGSGPGGYVAAIRCAQLGMKTAIIEKYPVLGGTCLNVGCIPSKALLDSTEHFHAAQHTFEAHGIELKGLQVNLKKMMERKDLVVKQNVDGIAFLMKKNKVDVYTGHGTFTDDKHIAVAGAGGQVTHLEAGHFIIATGSKPVSLPGVALDKKRIITSTEALQLGEIPKHLLIIGGGVIGLELGSVYARLGSRVSVIEFTDAIIGNMDRTMGKELHRSLKKLGIEFYLKQQVTGASVKGKEVVVTAKDSKGETVSFTGDYCLVSVGRKPYTENLGLEKAGVKTDAKGLIETDEQLRTAVKNIFAIGDVVKGPMLAHKAEEEGVFVAETIAGQQPYIQYRLIPAVVYTWPEVAGVGFTEEELKASGRKYKSGSFPYKALGRSRASMDTEGLVKILADAETDELLGAHIIGARAADMIAEAVVALEFRASAEDIARISHAHPTYTEAFREACLDATGKRAIHN